MKDAPVTTGPMAENRARQRAEPEYGTVQISGQTRPAMRSQYDGRIFTRSDSFNVPVGVKASATFAPRDPLDGAASVTLSVAEVTGYDDESRTLAVRLQDQDGNDWGFVAVPVPPTPAEPADPSLAELRAATEAYLAKPVAGEDYLRLVRAVNQVTVNEPVG